jgi:hypothetical protein
VYRLGTDFHMLAWIFVSRPKINKQGIIKKFYCLIGMVIRT